MIDREKQAIEREERARRAREADSLMENALLTEALVRVESDAIERMIQAEDEKERREGADRVLTVRGIRDYLRGVINAAHVQDKQRVV